MKRYIATMTHEEQLQILEALQIAGIEGEDLERAMAGRICDLEDTINIRPFVK